MTALGARTSFSGVKPLAILALLPLAAATYAAPEEGPAVPQPTVPPARDGNIAIEEELCAARKAGTVEAYDLFIARHPDHPLVAKARAERARIASRKP